MTPCEYKRNAPERLIIQDITVMEANNFNFLATTMANFPQQLDFSTPLSSFLSDENFEHLAAAKRVSEEAIDWKDLPMNIVFRVHALVPIQPKWGAQVILELKNREGEEFKVWAPSNVYKDLKSGMKLKGTEDVYIKSLGQKEAKTNTGTKKRYYDFETVYL